MVNYCCSISERISLPSSYPLSSFSWHSFSVLVFGLIHNYRNLDAQEENFWSSSIRLWLSLRLLPEKKVGVIYKAKNHNIKSLPLKHLIWARVFWLIFWHGADMVLLRRNSCVQPIKFWGHMKNLLDNLNLAFVLDYT